MSNVEQAVQALNVHRRRAALSVLGITIGIAAVMAVGTISRGGNHLIYRELETFGLNSVWLYRNWNTQDVSLREKSGTGIDNDDFLSLQSDKKILGIRSITPIVNPNWNWSTTRGNREANAQHMGVGRDYTQISNDQLIAGRFLNQNDIDTRQSVVLLAPQVVQNLFDATENPVGQHIYIDRKRFLVVGLLAGKSRDFLASIGSSGGQNADDRILMPFTTLQRMMGLDEIDTFQFEVEDFNQAENTAQAARQRLLDNHPVGFDYRAETMSSYIETTDRILNGVSIIGIVSASISLLVGGMGIMNVMGTAVLERTREIGVRKAIGAREKDIMMQFLMEAGLISAVGGLLGLAIGTIASFVLAKVTGFPVIPSTWQVLAALFISISVGLLSGFLPARRAAKMKPVQALRTE
ncbi:MAG: ABC transporter permease [Gammaproteobacteria bacterium]|nr:ABC transporter permease [Gammaproteobacteria bacterium]